MPARHVRFSTENTFHSPPPQLSWSNSSETSTPGPVTPPSLPYVSLPGPTPYAPRRAHTISSSGAKGRAHNLVAFTPSPMLNYDISVHPSAITTHFLRVSSAGFLEPAVYPPQSTITITTPHLPWSIAVAASNGRYVTVSDALNAIYRALRTNVTSAEFHGLGSQKLQRRVTEAYTHRYMRLRGHRGYAEEKSQGVKRVDFLMGCTKFHGLSATGAPDVWRLHVS
ncbi:hypothetical protein B0H16DRAFT_1627269 [Mycena metata]|uniref:DUF6699 domain-containing protein n=1 Tax=Mycena metata TaxID=1033252 RepID=A0AAD7H4Q5_9AGAR|nr:hypothetical protein B0H16DRAFT_1627269 [Mycena metata]